ncbi:PilZ domain-containing protein [Bradyrhizobium sp.]|jgi:hypothetical protein|uniref:PilZ domain-containing protein n=1 Tax=Bradyrhizobium sp. TaxID=376 RepID=UPI002E009D2F|nr:PilZ domain-containing protein [Bradyrhizobium sp.]
MIDRRQTARARVIYSGVVAFNQRQSTMDCVVRNFSDHGAKVEFENAALLPDQVDLVIPRKSRAFLAKIIWRQPNAAGVAFRPLRNNDPVPIDWARKLRASELERRKLQNRLTQLLSEH